MTDYDLHVAMGQPLQRQFDIDLPIGRDWWTALEDFEVSMKVREGRKNTSAETFDFFPFLDVTMPSADRVTIVLMMTGEETLTVKGGYYDLNLSNPGDEDARIFPIAVGAVRRKFL